ncbi:calcium/proton exchanger [Fonsecaea monophora]|uniref:Vacuolar calcium ion transporter n=2 Tax=Fonsecaea TaxID=40354 RepID=A0A0D2GDM4_9EURO|nr:calcium/proton exchanger [Fonsecaea pedrosoi CBS 271.37]XP_022510482.1 calcium/proton exchanger [Fonsecaea monophora]KAH0843532.1 Vacuolar calcium ion transporter [Fonsecaea pedrosoi]KIW78858.1 calcium/proton exchanger [Fonsecaea pedrosoi CBS 271.37]OAG38530.1 calcium/proton exchanger [Fonsecaea monophora]
MAALRKTSIAASTLRKKFAQTAHPSRDDILNMPEDGGLNGRADPNERTGLLSRITTTDSGTPFHKHENVWIKYPFLVLHLTWEILKTNYVNVLLVFVPVGILAGVLNWAPSLQFIFNFIAIIPLASLLAFATEELAIPLGQTIGGLLNATFGNAVELIVSIIALQKNEIRIVQASMLGSILSNILLVLGCCFFVGGLRYPEQSFNSTVASTMSSLMTVATSSLIIPATLYAVMSNNKAQDDNIMILSRGTSIILLLIYVAYLYFQLKSHANLFDDSEAQEQEGEEPQLLGPWAAGIVLVLITLLVAICAEYLVDSIDAIVEEAHISKTFIGLILIPIVGNAAEHVTAVIVAWKNKMDLAIGVAIGSSLQIAIFVTPFLVVLGWIMDRPMTLHFETFETVSFFLASLVVVLLIQDGKSNYLEGLLCLGMYFIIALAFYVLPDDAGTGLNLGKLFGGSGGA